MTKTSISLDPEFLKVLDDYRRTKDKIPTLSEAIRDLVKKALIPKEEITELPKGEKFSDLTIRVIDPRPGHGGTSLINLPYQKIKDDFKDKDQVDIIIIRR